MDGINHHIQRTILDRLAHAANLRFSELKPEGMESNIFMYHLKQLIRQGYVQKVGDGYELASQGLSYIDGLSNENYRPRHQPKLIAILALHDGRDKWLLAERKIQPYIDSQMFPSGKQHRGEISAEHAVRELAEKTGLSGIPLQYRGIADIQISDAEPTLLTHAVASVYEGKLASAELPPETDRFRFVWHNFAREAAPLMPGTAELYQALAQSGPFNIVLRVQT